MFTIDERFDSRMGTDTAQDLVYYAQGTDPVADTDTAAMAAVYSFAPATHNAQAKNSIISIRSVPANDLLWEIIVHYGVLGSETFKFVGASLSFSTQGATQHITQSLKTLFMSAAGGATHAPVFNGAIGVVSGSTPQGVDVPVPQFTFQIRYKFAATDITAAFLGILYINTGRTNNATWTVTCTFGSNTTQLSFDKGECQFLGASAPDPDPDGSVTMSLSFRGWRELRWIGQPIATARHKRIVACLEYRGKEFHGLSVVLLSRGSGQRHHRQRA